MVNKLSIFSVDHTQKSPLIWACIRNHHSIAKSLIDAGSDPNKEDQNGFNALYYAIKYDSAECVRVLMIELTWFDDSHANSTLSASEKVRNIFRLGSNLSKAMRKIDPEKREGLFNEQYRYFYEWSHQSSYSNTATILALLSPLSLVRVPFFVWEATFFSSFWIFLS